MIQTCKFYVLNQLERLPLVFILDLANMLEMGMGLAESKAFEEDSKHKIKNKH